MAFSPLRPPPGGESGLIQRVRARLEALHAGTCPAMVVGFSGGVDSLALLGIFAALERRHAVSTLAVHVDHRMRPESRDEQIAAGSLATSLGVAFLGVSLDGDALRRHAGVGVEEAARRERYRALAEVARERGTGIIALAHQQEDQAETVLLHLLRGAGTHGAAAMAEWCVRPIPWWEPTGSQPLALWRPLLPERRSALAGFVAALGLAPVEDPSNRSPSMTRNRLRHEAMPLLDGIVPGATASLARYAAIAADEDALLERLASDHLRRIENDGRRLRASELNGIDRAVRRRVIRLWIERVAGGAVELSLQRCDAVAALARADRGNRTIEIGGGWNVALRDGVLSASDDAISDQGWDGSADP